MTFFPLLPGPNPSSHTEYNRPDSMTPSRTTPPSTTQASKQANTSQPPKHTPPPLPCSPGVLVLESLEHAQARGATILGEYLGGAFTCDAHHMTDPHPEGLGVSTCIVRALEDAGVDRDAVNYVNAHATSTLVGDKAEIKALRSVFGDMKGIKINATKSMIGHCLGAAGGMEAVATLQAIRTGWVHPTLNHDDPIPEVDGLDVVPNTKSELDIKVGISNSFGFGGHNSVVAFAPYKA